jgi:hypothetical protein
MLRVLIKPAIPKNRSAVYHHTMKYLVMLIAAPLWAQTVDQLELHQVAASKVQYQGKDAVRLLARPNVANGESYAVLKGERFHNGTIEASVAGKPGANAAPDARGFIGIAFRLQGNRYEYIYLRPTNGRADDQVRRNHSTQYGAHPDYDFDRLRRESPEKYESYVDLEPGVWTRYKIVIDGTKARLYVNGAEQPCLIVNDLKLGDSQGGVALWVGPGTEGYFADLKITP